MNATTRATPSSEFHDHCLALLMAVFLAMVPRPAVAAHAVPFRATLTTEFQSVVAFPFALISVTGEGHALHMGAITAASTDQTVNLLTGEGTATYTLTAANDDTIVLSLEFLTTFQGAEVTFEGSYLVTGGTGRFAGATGAGTASGSATFTGPSNGFGSFAMHGTIPRHGG